MTPIKLNNTTRADSNMSGGYGKEINGEWYYNFDEAQKTAQEQNLTLPTLQDFLDSGFTKKWTEDNKKLADKLGLKLSGYCDSDGTLHTSGECGFLGSVSESNEGSIRSFDFNESKGTLDGSSKNASFVCRPLVKNSNPTIGLFEKLCERAEEHGATLGAKAGYDLGKILN